MAWVFAYGSNMHLPDLRRWLRANGEVASPRRVAAARVAGFRLAWNYFSRSRDGGAANVEPLAGSHVRGLALLVDDALLKAIDRKEGHPHRYDRGAAAVPAEFLHSDERVDVWLYRVRPAHRSDEFVPPRSAYLRLMIEAATKHRLGDEYVAELRGIRTAG